MSSQLSKNILATLAYYDVMDYPLTSFEIWKHLTRITNYELRITNEPTEDDSKYSLLEIINDLENENLKKFIEEHRGFYFLKGRKSLVEERIKRNKISEKKFKILLRVARVLRFVPYVRMVAVTGRMAMKNTEEKSDLDLLLVLEQGKIFTGRILVTLAVHLMGRRRYRGKIANRVCLNYFITTNSFEIGLKDMFSASEYYFMLPLFGREAFERFQEKNSWIGEYKVNYEKSRTANLKMLSDNFLTRLIRQIGEKVLSASFIEKGLRAWQMERINRNPKTHQAGSLVVAGDQALIFLPSPQGPKIYDKFQERLSSLARIRP